MFAPLLCLALMANEPLYVEIVRATYDLRSILPTMTEPARAIQTLPLTPHRGRDVDLFEGQEYRFSAETLADLLTQTVQPEEWEYEGRSLDLRDDGRLLIVQAPATVQAEVRRFLEYVALATNSRIAVNIQIFSSLPGAGSGQPPVGRLQEQQRAEVAELVHTGALDPVWTFRMELLSGVPSTRLDTVNHAYLRDYDVEIAQSASVTEPIIDQFPTGVALTARADRDTNDLVLLSLVLRHSWTGGRPQSMDARTITRIAGDRVAELDSGGQVQSPRVSFATLAGSVRLRAGESAGWLASPITLEGGAGTYVLMQVGQLARTPEPFESGQRFFAIRDVAGHCSDGFRCPEDTGLELGFPFETVEERYLPAALNLPPINDRVADVMDELIDSVGNSIEEDVSLGLQENFVYVIGDRKPAALVLRQLMGGLPQTRGLQGLSATLAPSLTQASGSYSLLALTANVGDGFAVCGSQETYILSYNVEVANNCSVFDPEVEAIVDGWAARFSASKAPTEVGGVSLIVKTHLREDARKEHAALLFGMGGLHLPAFREGIVEGYLTGTRPTELGEIRRPGGEPVQIVVRGLE